MTKIRTELLIETSETFTVKRKRTFTRSWCEDCGQEVGMASPQEAAMVTGHDVNAIRSMMENRLVHFHYLKPERPWVCLRSLWLFEN